MTVKILKIVQKVANYFAYEKEMKMSFVFSLALQL